MMVMMEMGVTVMTGMGVTVRGKLLCYHSGALACCQALYVLCVLSLVCVSQRPHEEGLLMPLTLRRRSLRPSMASSLPEARPRHGQAEVRLSVTRHPLSHPNYYASLCGFRISRRGFEP